jgi:hypothetical protein
MILRTARCRTLVKGWLYRKSNLLMAFGAPGSQPSPRDHFGGTLGGRMPLAGAGLSQLLLAQASVRPVQGLYGGYRDCLVVHGKEKVYGSIP